MLEKIAKIADKYEELTSLLSEPEVLNDAKRFQSLSKEQAKLAPISEVFQKLTQLENELQENEEISNDPNEDSEMKELAREEIKRIKKDQTHFNEECKILLLPKNPNDAKNIILEIRAGTGGEEAALFVSDLYKMYRKFAEKNSWKTEVMGSHPTGIGGLKEIVMSIEGKEVYSKLKFESGTHRVQRVPSTETQGRVHTSAVTVAVLAEVDEVDVNINTTDLKIDTYRSQGAGGQHVNTTDSAVRITHTPTGIVVTCQEERSQIKNRNKAMKYLRAKLFESQQEKVSSEEAALRKNMVGTGDRSEKIRTYNYPQGRVTEHRINMTLYKLEEIMSTGDIYNIINSLTSHEQAEMLKAANFN